MEKISTLQNNSGQALMNLSANNKTNKNVDLGFKEMVKKVNPPKLNTKDNFKPEIKTKNEPVKKQTNEPKFESKTSPQENKKVKQDTSKGQDTKVNDKDVDKTEAPKDVKETNAKETNKKEETNTKEEKTQEVVEENTDEVNQNALVNQMAQVNPIQENIDQVKQDVILVDVDTENGNLTIRKTQMTQEELDKVTQEMSQKNENYDKLIEQISQDPNFKEAWAKVKNGEKEEEQIEIPKHTEILFSMQKEDDGKITITFKELEQESAKDLLDRGTNSRFNQTQDLEYELNSLRNLDVNEENNIEETTNIVNGNNINFISKTETMMNPLKESGQVPRTIQNFAEIIDEIRAANKNNKSEIDIKLQPENLGKLSIKINSENGILNASFYVDNDKAKQALEMQMSALKQVLQNQGLQIANLDVQLGKGNEDLNRHKNIMEAQNYNLKTKGVASGDEGFEEMVNPYIPSENEFEEII